MGKRLERPVMLKEFLFDDVPIGIEGPKAQAGLAKHLADAPLLVDAPAAEWALARPTASGRRGINLKSLGNSKVKWKKMQNGAGEGTGRAVQVRCGDAHVRRCCPEG